MKKIVFFFALLLMLFSLCSCFTFRKSDKATISRLKKDSIEITANYFKYKGSFFRYLFFENGNQTLPLLVLIHGAPGSSSNFLDFLKNKSITNNYSVIIVDRLGYGFSQYGNYAPITNQADVIIEVIQKVMQNQQDVFIAGHSYGATIAAAISSLRPAFLTASVLMAPALDPDNEKYFWFGKVGIWKGTRWMISGALKVAADEKYKHAEELQTWSGAWKNINTPVFHIHGNKDNLVPFINTTYTKTNISSTYLEMYEWPGMDHFFPFSDTDKTIELMYNYCQKHRR